MARAGLTEQSKWKPGRTTSIIWGKLSVGTRPPAARPMKESAVSCGDLQTDCSHQAWLMWRTDWPCTPRTSAELSTSPSSGRAPCTGSRWRGSVWTRRVSPTPRPARTTSVSRIISPPEFRWDEREDTALCSPDSPPAERDSVQAEISWLRVAASLPPGGPLLREPVPARRQAGPRQTWLRLLGWTSHIHPLQGTRVSVALWTSLTLLHSAGGDPATAEHLPEASPWYWVFI